MAINRIALAKLRDNDQVKPESWFSRTSYQTINRFINVVTSRYLSATGTHMAASLRI